MSRPRLIALLLALATLLVYLPVARNGFINYDDGDYVTANPMVQNGWTPAGVTWAFTTFHSANWHPLTWLSHMTDCELFGLNPAPIHLVNALFHVANTVLLFVLLLRLTEKIWPAAFVAALFAVHPLHVESVAWISERKDVLSTFFGLLSLLCYVKAMTGDKRVAMRPLSFSLLFFAGSLMSKPMLVTLPFVMLLLDFWPLKRVERGRLKVAGSQTPKPSTFNLQLVIEKLPFFTLTIASCVVTYIAQNQGAVKSLKAVPLDYRLENVPVALADYLLKLFWPSHLAVIYPMPDFIPAIAVVVSSAVLVAITVAVWLVRQQNPFLLMGWLWFLGMLVPVIGLVKVGDAAMADRYTYFPAIGIFIAVAFGAEKIARRFQLPKFILPGVAVLVLGIFIALTERQLQFWRNDATLFGHALKVTQNNVDAYINYGVALEKQNRPDDALAQYRAAEKIAPDSVFVHNNLGTLLDNFGRHNEAAEEYRKAIKLDPNNTQLHDSLGIVLSEMGKFPDAMSEFAAAMQLNPKDPWPHFDLGKTLLQQGRDAEAVDEFRTAVRLDPKNFKTLTYVARILASDKNDSVRDGKSALALAEKANDLTGGQQPLVLDALGMAYAETGDFTNAIAVTQSALDIATAAQLTNTNVIQQRLELYQNHQPWRESFLATNVFKSK